MAYETTEVPVERSQPEAERQIDLGEATQVLATVAGIATRPGDGENGSGVPNTSDPVPHPTVATPQRDR